MWVCMSVDFLDSEIQFGLSEDLSFVLVNCRLVSSWTFCDGEMRVAKSVFSFLCS